MSPPSKPKRGLEGMQAFTEKAIDTSEIKNLPKKDAEGSYLSHSQIEAYLTCAKAYEYRYVLEEASPQVFVMAQGNAVHKALETNYKQKIESKTDLKVSDVINVFSQEFDDRMTKIEDTLSKSDIGNKKDQTIGFLKDYHKKVSPTIQPFKVEESFKLQVAPTIRLVGFIDLIQQLPGPQKVSPTEEDKDRRTEIEGSPKRDLVIVDHKVTSRKKTQQMADEALQLSVYSMATGIPNVRFDTLIPTKDSAELGVGYAPVLGHRTSDQLRFAESVIISVAQAISAGIFPKTGMGTWKCNPKFCPHYNKCHYK